MSKYTPATFQPTVRPDWAGVLSYLSESEKSDILVALLKYPSVECNSKFWLETIKPDLDLQYASFVKSCQEKSRAVRNRWAKTSISDGIDIYKTSIRDGIDTEREREREKEGEGEDESELPAKKEIKKTYGEMGTVKLTDEEYNKLKFVYGQVFDIGIDILDRYLASGGGKKYKSHYAVMRQGGWVYTEAKKQEFHL